MSWGDFCLGAGAGLLLALLAQATVRAVQERAFVLAYRRLRRPCLSTVILGLLRAEWPVTDSRILLRTRNNALYISAIRSDRNGDPIDHTVSVREDDVYLRGDGEVLVAIARLSRLVYRHETRFQITGNRRTEDDNE